MYYRAVMEGMERCEVDGQRNDPQEFFGAATYNYLLHWHTKRMSSARAEYSGVKNIRGVFNNTHRFCPEGCKTDEALEELLAKGRELLKGEELPIATGVLLCCRALEIRQKICFTLLGIDAPVL